MVGGGRNFGSSGADKKACRASVATMVVEAVTTDLAPGTTIEVQKPESGYSQRSKNNKQKGENKERIT